MIDYTLPQVQRFLTWLMREHAAHMRCQCSCLTIDDCYSAVIWLVDAQAKWTKISHTLAWQQIDREAQEETR